jgi:hypothetical protein
VTNDHLEIAIIAKKEETATGQVKRQGNAWTVFQLIWNCSHRIHPRKRDCKQAPLQGDPLPSKQFNFSLSALSFGTGRTGCCYMTMPLHTALCLSKIWQNNRSLTSSHTMRFLFLSPLERKSTWASTSVGWGDRHCHKGSRMGPSCKYLSAAFSAAIPTLADLHSGQQQPFWGSMWICVSVCQYLVIWWDKTIVHKITDCSCIILNLIILQLMQNKQNYVCCHMFRWLNLPVENMFWRNYVRTNVMTLTVSTNCIRFMVSTTNFK